MIAIGPLAFTAPLALLALIALPFLWLLLRATPPAPSVVVFAPLRLLQNLAKTPETPDSTPWWLIVLRMTLASLIVLALARPVWSPQSDFNSDRPVLVIIDDGWSSVSSWPVIQSKARSQLQAARADGRDTALLYTASSLRDDTEGFGPANLALARLDAHTLSPWSPDRETAVERLQGLLDRQGAPDSFDTIWVSDGLAWGDGDSALARLASRYGDLEVLLPTASETALAITTVRSEPDGFTATLVRADTDQPRAVSVTALTDDGQALARAEGVFETDADRLELSARLPLDLRNRIARIAIDSETSAGATHITGDRWRRPRIGVLEPEGSSDTQPLLSDFHYVREALSGSAELISGDLRTIMAAEPAGLVMVDAARTDNDQITEFVETGGLLIRFAGPRLAARADGLLPVRLREGGRLFGGAMAWDSPQSVSAFSETSPFAGLTPPDEALVTRQVLAEPGPDLEAKVWARLTDGTPLVTAERRGQGWIVLFHVTAGPDWSSLPLSGLYPAMLTRVLSLSDGADAATPSGGAWGLERVLNAQGRLDDPRMETQLIDAGAFHEARASAQTPPGIWSLGAASAAINVLQPGDTLTLMARDLPGAVYRVGTVQTELRLGGILLGLALVLLALDGLVTLILSGRLPTQFKMNSSAGAVVLGLALVSVPNPHAHASEGVIEDALEVRLGYVLTGDGRIDDLSRAALAGISRESTRRSAVEPTRPVGVNIETDEILFYPMLYWPVTETAPTLSPEAAARVTAYMNAGGLIVFDTRDGRTAASRSAPHPGLVRILEAVDVPPLQSMPDDHVLGRTFYLLNAFPGRFPDTQIWVESNPEGSARDGVSSVVIGSADWASAWAIDEQGRPLAPVEGGPRQRELAIRFGVNLAMYALTGNYKADQVHIPAILERLGEP